MGDMGPNKITIKDGDSLQNVFVCQLSLLYAAKNHLVTSLPNLIEKASFVALKHALIECLEDSQKQMLSLDEIFRRLNASAITHNCFGMNKIIQEAYELVEYLNDKDYESDMSIIFYMGVIEHMQIGASSMLKLVAKEKTFHVYQQLVQETLDISKDNAELFHSIACKYIYQK